MNVLGVPPVPHEVEGSVALVLNPSSRSAALAQESVVRVCEASGLPAPVVLTTTVAEPGGAQAEAALAAGCRRIVVAGGDGTVREVAGALLHHAPEEATLGIVPIGTANLYARNLGLPIYHAEGAALLAVTGPGRPTDVGTVVLTAADGHTVQRSFLVVVGLGEDADIVASVDPRTKERLRWLAYFTPGLSRLRRPGRPLLVTLDEGTEVEEQLWSLLAVNGGRLPAGAQVAPGARPDDGLLHVVAVSPRHLGDWARIGLTGVTGWRRDWPALRYRTGRRLRVRSAEPVTAQVDGDPVADIVDALIELRPGALRVAAPRR